MIGRIAKAITLCIFLSAIFAGLWIRELAKFRDASSNTQWVNWIGEYRCGSQVAISRPQTLDQLQDVVRKNQHVRAAATGRSFNFYHCPKSSDGAVVDIRAFKEVELLDMTGGRYAVTAQAGIEMGQLQNRLLANGLTLRVPPGNPGYSFGAVVANGCHNMGQSHAEDFLAVTFVTHDGSIRHVKRGETDWLAAGMSQGRLGVIFNATIEVLPYRSFQWSAEESPIPDIDGILRDIKVLATNVTSLERTGHNREVATGNKLVFYLENGVMVKEYWEAQSRISGTELGNSSARALPAYENPLMFRLGGGLFSDGLSIFKGIVFDFAPAWVLRYLQVPAEMAFLGMHTSASLQWVRKLIGWQHSPQSRGDMGAKPSGHQYTWAAWLDEAFNWLMRLHHIEVIFPIEPKEKAAKCLKVVFDHKHLIWWRLNIRVTKSEEWFLSAVHSEDRSQSFARVDFLVPGNLLEQPSGEVSLTAQLHTDCPGWRKHWGKALWATSADEPWGNPVAFSEAAARWDPVGKFEPLNLPGWLKPTSTLK